MSKSKCPQVGKYNTAVVVSSLAASAYLSSELPLIGMTIYLFTVNKLTANKQESEDVVSRQSDGKNVQREAG